MKTGDYRLTRGTCFVGRRLEVVAFAGLLWIPWCVLGAAGFRAFCFCFRFCSNAHGLLQVLGPLASFTSLLLPTIRTRISLYEYYVALNYQVNQVLL